jgi:hypothetical protein
MILHVEFDQFLPTVKRMLDSKDIYLRLHGGTAVLTAASPAKPIVVASAVNGELGQIRQRVENEGFTVYDGEWTDAGEGASDRLGDRQAYIAAVAYQSRERVPGLWLDAYPTAPAQGVVLRAFYDELLQNGEIPEVSFEEFIRLANPNIVIIGPSEIQSYLADKDTC